MAERRALAATHAIPASRSCCVLRCPAVDRFRAPKKRGTAREHNHHARSSGKLSVESCALCFLGDFGRTTQTGRRGRRVEGRGGEGNAAKIKCLETFNRVAAKIKCFETFERVRRCTHRDRGRNHLLAIEKFQWHLPKTHNLGIQACRDISLTATQALPRLKLYRDVRFTAT